MTFMILDMLSVDKRTNGSWLGPWETLTSEVSIGIRYSEISLKDANTENGGQKIPVDPHLDDAHSFPDNPRGQSPHQRRTKIGSRSGRTAAHPLEFSWNFFPSGKNLRNPSHFQSVRVPGNSLNSGLRVSSFTCPSHDAQCVINTSSLSLATAERNVETQAGMGKPHHVTERTRA